MKSAAQFVAYMLHFTLNLFDRAIPVQSLSANDGGAVELQPSLRDHMRHFSCRGIVYTSDCHS